MIERAPAFRVGTQSFLSLEGAQEFELEKMIPTTSTPLNKTDIAKWILKNKDNIVDILTMTPTSKPKARTFHGGKKNRAPKTVITDSNVTVDSTVNVPTAVVTPPAA